MGVIERESREWAAYGTKPDPGEEIYVAGEQPFASYDNWAMWAVTRDIKQLNEVVGAHGGRHEAGGADELNLHNLSAENVVQLHADTAARRYELVYPETGTTVTAIDMDANRVETWPAFNPQIKFNSGLTTADDIRKQGTDEKLYDATVNKFHHAKEADHAQTADVATQADTLAPDYEVDHATTADYATEAGHAQTADDATDADFAENAANAQAAQHAAQADNADTLDGWHADGLLDEAVDRALERWKHICRKRGGGENKPCGWHFEFDLDLQFDRYRLVIRIESHVSFHQHCRVRIQSDTRNRYNLRWLTDNNSIRSARGQDHWSAICPVPPNQVSVHEVEIAIPTPLNRQHNNTFYPTISSVSPATATGVPSVLQYGELEADYSSLQVLDLETTGNASGSIDIFGMDIGTGTEFGPGVEL